jgi:hypothetical protein
MGDDDDHDVVVNNDEFSVLLSPSSKSRTLINHFRANLYYTKGASSSRTFEQTSSKTQPVTQSTGKTLSRTDQ